MKVTLPTEPVTLESLLAGRTFTRHGAAYIAGQRIGDERFVTNLDMGTVRQVERDLLVWPIDLAVVPA